jgi:hypothetical protein
MSENDETNGENGFDKEKELREPPPDDDDGFPTQKETRDHSGARRLRIEPDEAQDEGFPTERTS